MSKSLTELKAGFATFKANYTEKMHQLAGGQSPTTMIVSCADSRVDPAIILQCDPGDLFITRNVANIVPPYEADARHHGTSAALEFGICYLNIKHLIIWGHSNCGGINAYLNPDQLDHDDFLTSWVDVLTDDIRSDDVDCCAKKSLLNSRKNAMTFPWIKERVQSGALKVDLFFFDIEKAALEVYEQEQGEFILI